MIALLVVLSLFGCKAKMEPSQKLDAQQLVVVTTPGWDATSGTLTAYERAEEKWTQVLDPIEVQVGRSGLAWGPGLHANELNQLPLKKEGDGRSPAGVFRLESLYGYGELQAKMPYLQVDTNTFCVDDPRSKYYNQIVSGDVVQKDWNSAETMRMESDVYKYGIVVGYNTGKAEPGAGSCIFMHLGQPGTTTAGCTAMAEADILKIIQWLDKSKNPTLVQAPQMAYQQLAQHYLLP